MNAGEINIARTNANQTIRIIGVQNDKLQYLIQEKGKKDEIIEAAIKAGDTINVDLSQGAGDGTVDSFSVGNEADLTNYNLMITGGKGNEYIGFAGGAKLGDLTLDTAEGDDSVQFGEGVQARKINAKLGDGKDSFQVFNRYQDEVYRLGDDRFTDEKISAERAPTAGLKAEELKVDEGAGEDLFLLGSYAKVANGVEVLGGEPANEGDPAKDLENEARLKDVLTKLVAELEKLPPSERQKELETKLKSGSLNRKEYEDLVKALSGQVNSSKEVENLMQETDQLLDEIGFRADGITVMDQVDAKIKLDGGRGNDYYYIGTRKDLPSVEINNAQDQDNIDIDKAEDVTLTNDQPLKLTLAVNNLQKRLGDEELKPEEIKALNDEWTKLQAGKKDSGTVRIRAKS